MTPALTLMRSILIGLTTLAVLAFGAPAALALDAPRASDGADRAQIATVTNPCPRNLDAVQNAFTYDHDGNLTDDGSATYTWDARGQLDNINGGVTADFVYDAWGRRVERDVDSITRGWLYAGTNQVAELDDQSSPTASLESLGIDGWLSRTTGGIRGTYLTDALGSPIAVGADDGTFNAKASYDPFGQSAVEGNLEGSDIGFTGRQQDGTGLMYYRARYYSPELGRFISEDPAGLAGGTNAYAYVGNSPTNATDPSGQVPALLVGCATEAAIGAIGAYATYRLAGRKVDWGGVGSAAVLGCLSGGLAFGLTPTYSTLGSTARATGAISGARSSIQGSRVVSGQFPRNAGPGDILIRRGADGRVTNYQTYGPDGLPLKRVDVTGRAHGGVETPHVVDFERHVNPVTGEVFVRPGSTVRPATPEELMGLD